MTTVALDEAEIAWPSGTTHGPDFIAVRSRRHGSPWFGFTDYRSFCEVPIVASCRYPPWSGRFVAAAAIRGCALVAYGLDGRPIVVGYLTDRPEWMDLMWKDT